MMNSTPLHQQILLRDLEQAVLRLADAVESEPPISSALRRFAGTLPGAPPCAPAPSPLPSLSPRRGDIRGTLYRALDAGAIDARGFDWLMLADSRARRAQGRRGSSSRG